MNKIYKIAGFVACLSLTTACMDKMEFPDYNKLPQKEFWQTEEDALKSITACYGQFTSDWAFFDNSIMGPEEIASDNTRKGSTVGQQADVLAFHDFSFTPALGRFNSLWTSRYSLINKCNQTLHYLPGMSFNEESKNQIMGEAKFIRAWCYFELVRLFGEVIIYENLPTDGSYDLPKSSIQEVYGLILRDLRDGFNMMRKTEWPNEWKGRVTAWSARALEAKVLMYMASGNNFMPDAQAINGVTWNDVKTVAEDVITNSGYALYVDAKNKENSFYQLFRLSQENCKESIFEVQNAFSLTNGALGSAYAHQSWIKGQSGDNPEDKVGGFGYSVPSDELVATWTKRYQEQGDQRFKASVIFRGDVLPDGGIVAGVDQLEGITGTPRYNYKVYIPYNEWSKKKKDWYLVYAEQNQRLFRYADLLLIHAEACVQLNQPSEGLNSINQVRERAGENAFTEADMTLQNIWDERRFELAFENDRYFDLVRTGLAKTILSPRGWKYPKHVFYPIPQEQIDLSNKVLKQNPNYLN